MSEYTRTTRECSVSELQPELLQAIQSYFQEQRLGALQAESLMCCETVSKKAGTGKAVSWLSGTSDTTIYTGMLLTSQWLIWVHLGDRSGVLLNAAELRQIRVKYYTSPLTKDCGLEIAGYIGAARGRVRGYVGMGADVPAQKFCEAVREAIARIKPPAKKGLFGWLKG